MRVGVLTISDRVSRGVMTDLGGSAIVESLRLHFPEIDIIQQVVPDEPERIQQCLSAWSDESGLDAILTTGGTGLGPRDVTPEATLSAITTRIQGIEEALRAKGLETLPSAMLSRGIAGVRLKTLIVNLPGSPGGARDGTQLLASVLPHAIDLLHGRTAHDHRAGAGA